MKIVFASENEGKIKELNTLLSDFNLEVIPQNELGVTSIPEVGLTFVENAILKARHASYATALPALADDSGLEVMALNGKPGVYSSRYAGSKASSKDNITKLLNELQTIPVGKRQASFYCALVFLLHAEDPTPLICFGQWEGTILSEPQGTHGFGYDPIFFDDKIGLSAAELDPQTKNQLSHRGKALRLLLKEIPKKIL